MAAAVRLSPLLLLWLVAYLTSALVYASPVTPNYAPSLFPRADAIIKEVNGEVQVFGTSDNQIVPQGPASDGAGSGFNGPAILWIGITTVLGLPLALAGVRGWRFTTGAGIGLASAVCSWAAFINTVNNVGISDMLLSVIVIAFFALGFILGLFEIGRLAGLTLLGITGGLAFGIRIMLLKSDLLIPVYFANWLVIALFGAVGGLLIVYRQRAAITLSSASAGTFLVFLALDLALNKQNGMSRGLRFLFDRNSSHLADIITTGYKAPLSTQIIIGVSLLSTPLLAYAQHRFFPHPFSRKPSEDWVIQTFTEDQRSILAKPFRSRFSL